MKLTTERIKELIKEELENMQEIAAANPKQDPIAYLDRLMPKYARGYQNKDNVKKEIEALKQDILKAKEVIDGIETISFEVDDTYREAYYQNIIKAIDIYIKDNNKPSGEEPNFSTLRSYLRGIDKRKVREVYMIRTLEAMGHKVS
tara:strand:- start:67 stop:504 length:438 start_codon:yes stop_codon:yes gene_type:complete